MRCWAGFVPYLFAHTTRRIDVGWDLNCSVISWRCRWPTSKRDEVGDTVARVREFEQIRQFLTGNAVTVVLDVVFTIVFLGVMWIYGPRSHWS